jgi:hypothetical protein
MSKYLIRLTKTEELTVTVHADTAPQAEALALDEVLGLEWTSTKIRVQSVRNLTANETNNTVTSPEL